MDNLMESFFPENNREAGSGRSRDGIMFTGILKQHSDKVESVQRLKLALLTFQGKQEAKIRFDKFIFPYCPASGCLMNCR